MIAVTGSARTGTSMMMQTLGHLGLKLGAEPFMEVHDPIKEYNPKGFFETDWENLNINDVQGDVVKMFGSELYDNVCLTAGDHPISHVIVCMRSKDDAIASSLPVLKKLGYDQKPSEIYRGNYQLINMCVKEIPTIIVKFEQVVENPEREIKKVVEFLKLNPTTENLNKAIHNIN